MMDYKEMAAIVKERGDAIIAEKNARANRIKRISLCASGIAAAAAAAFCVWQNKSMGVSPSLEYENSQIISDMTSPTASPDAVVTTAAEKTSDKADTKPVRTSASAVRTETVSTAASSSAKENAPKATSNSAVNAVQTSYAAADTTVRTGIISVQTTEAVTAFDYETAYNEGRTIMKHFAALSAALLTLSNTVPAAAAETAPYKRPPQQLTTIENFKTCVEEYGMDIDLNCDGTIDIFDVYAAYRSYHPSECPDYINEKAAACQKIIDGYNTDHNVFLDDIIPYFMEYYPMKPEYFQPDYYIDNCPDVYTEEVPLEYVGHEGGLSDVIDMYNTMYYKEENGSYVCTDFLSRDVNDVSQKYCVPMVYNFIANALRFDILGTTAGYSLLSELLENGTLDADINSDGKFDHDDIMLLGFFEEYFYDDYDKTYIGTWDENDVYHKADSAKLHRERRTYEGFLEYYDSWGEDARSGYFSNHRLSESEWSKGMKFYDTALLYDYNSYDVLEILFTYYIVNNKVDFAIFDDNYYISNDTYLHNCFWGHLEKYKDIAETYGVNKIKEPVEEEPDLRFLKYDVEEMFPKYYADVKSGKLPEPDINKDGKVDIRDYAFFRDIFAEFPEPGAPSYMVYVTIDAPQNVRDAFNSDYDFNNNGISCDLGELNCIELYIAKALGAADYNDVQDMLDNYYAENPDLDPNVKLNESIKGMSKDDTPENVSDAKTNSLQTYMSSLDLFADVTGDANIDDKVDISDSVLIMQSISNPDKYNLTPKGKRNADSNGDGVTSYDALAIQKKLLRL